ncbi:MAG: hypothetical protein PHD06_07405 [Bacteroidales bacterium]|jgi:hypothetical protein|nr:hypothetical protein [Bacteroidales bacterium]MDD4384990.1 hypothetical protein [Bacteroidales bacterium]MDY0196467.1 hypothetical protein [Tenuifilaceae bacterium]
MKRLMSLTILLALVFAFATGTNAQERYSRKEIKAHYNSSYNYEVQIMGVGQDGTKVMKVWGFGKRVEDAIIEAKMNAVASVIFKGIPGGYGAAATPAILTDPNAADKNAEYFNSFFSPGGKYLQFITMTTDGMPSGQDRLKVKKGFKVAIYAQVMYDALRKQLETDGIARRLDSGF